jgi:hypothetical protein
MFEICGPCQFSVMLYFVSFQNFGKCDNQRQVLNKCVKCTSGPLGRCLRHSFGIPQFHRTFAVSMILIISVCHRVLLYPRGCCLQIQALPGIYPSFMVVTQVMQCELIF